MAKYDLERFMADIGSIIVNKLPAKIDAINAEKADAIVMKNIDPDAIYLQQTSSEIINFDPYLVYGIDEITKAGNGPNAAMIIKASAVIVVADDASDFNMSNRMFRYMRALEEIFAENWTNNYGVRVNVGPSVPVPLIDLKTEERFRAVGVELDASFAP